MSDRYRVDSAATAEVSRHERADFWSALVVSYQCQMAFRYARPECFTGSTSRQSSDSYQLVHWRVTGPMRAERTAGHVRRHPDPDYRLLLQVSGTATIKHGDDVVSLPPGTASLFTMNQPFELNLDTPNRAFILTIPRREVHRHLGGQGQVGGTTAMRSGLGNVVLSMVSGLSAGRNTLDQAQFDATCDRLVELLCLHMGTHAAGSTGHPCALEADARRYVREHAEEPELCGAQVAHALGWSLRQVQRTLRDAGTTPSELIREERLRLVRERLQSPAYRHWTISELATASGFSSLSVLSSAFRERFGSCPRDFRPTTSGNGR